MKLMDWLGLGLSPVSLGSARTCSSSANGLLIHGLEGVVVGISAVKQVVLTGLDVSKLA